MTSRTNTLISSNEKDHSDDVNYTAFKNIPCRIIYKENYIHKDIRLEKDMLDYYDPEIHAIYYNNTKALDIKPRKLNDSQKVLIYLHGDQNVFSSLKNAVPISYNTGLRVICIDYENNKQDATIDKVLNTFKFLLKQGYHLDNIGIYGNNFGGGIATAAVLKMRNEGMGIPGAMILCAPNCDLIVKSCLNENFEIGFPPTLIQANFKKVGNMSFLKYYQRFNKSGVDVKLDMYEGAIFSKNSSWNNKNNQLAITKISSFLKTNLNY
ncbi:alpha/beta hydrolase [Aureivirga marina]|uniref:alpha/beta hydrolase n=1 Tax=Aureivirga marina TaxID=1182451 RepID=UPI0018CA6276|nr:alpha/beta hydrolase fold domain-containing protein [Aureivirga marina]